MIEPLDRSSGNVLGFKLSGKLHDEDYQHFVPVVDAALKEHEKVRLLALLEDFHGWDMHAAWDDIKFAVGHYSEIERVAMVGDKKWQEWMTKVCKPFTTATVKYFNASELDAAWAWVSE